MRLLKAGDLKKVECHLFKGGEQNAINALKKAGFKVIIY